MAGNVTKDVKPLLDAIAFAARAHEGQLRKDGRTPYVSHVFRVCLVLRHVFGVEDRQALAAAVLHDTIEDTRTDFDDLQEQFDPRVAEWAARLSKDKRLEDAAREEQYVAQLLTGPWQVKVCKLADIFDNLLDSAGMKPEQRARTFKRSQFYLDRLKQGLPPEARRPWQIVAELLADLQAGEAGRAGGA
jgi:guanosine-3',5'-bis(diphosphate) 3'-pyrophosphohydrolase